MIAQKKNGKPTWLKEMDRLIAARSASAVLTFNTSDRVYLRQEGRPIVASLHYFLAQYFSSQGYSVGHFSMSWGFRELNPPGADSQRNHQGCSFRDVKNVEDPLMVLNGLSRILRNQSSRAVVLFDYAEHLAPHGGSASAVLSPEQYKIIETLHGWGIDDDIRLSDNFIILISYDNAVNSLITESGGYRTIPIDLPEEEQRRGFGQFLLDARERGLGDEIGALSEDLDIAEFGRVTSGLRLRDIEDLFRSCGPDERISVDDVRKSKKISIKEMGRGLLEVIEPKKGFESVAGCVHVKGYMQNLKWLWKQGHSSCPQAILLAGVPGCGKSFIVSAIAKELNCPLLAMRGVRSMWVGESERNLDHVLWITENLAPCILWTDEVDQVIGQRGNGSSGDSGTSERMFGRIMEFFGSMAHRGKILWIATTNRPEVIDKALADRFAVKIPFLHPSSEERTALIPLLAEQIGRSFRENVDFRSITSIPELEMLTARSLQEIIVLAGMRADVEAGTAGHPIAEENIIQAIAEHIPSDDQLEHQFMALKALEMTSFVSLLPWMKGGAFEGLADWPEYLMDIVDQDSGRIIGDVLRNRIAELRRKISMDRMR